MRPTFPQRTPAKFLGRPTWVSLLLTCWGSFAAPPGFADQPQRPAVLLQMIRDDAVHEELGLTQTQTERLHAELVRVDAHWWPGRNLPDSERRSQLERLTARLHERLRGILRPEQTERLTQLERQALGTRMLLTDDVAETLELTAPQRTRLTETFLETDRLAAELSKQPRSGEATDSHASRKFEKRKDQEREQIQTVLSTSQRARIRSLTGDPFDFARVKRTLPIAPEFSTEGATWLQGNPMTLADLRGKVVAIQFYAFQCINCQRNFPLYQAWHRDYADEGLVIIGIQTPETAAERDVDRVATAIKKDGFEFPVLMDAESSNWDAWGNTMWPTVYLIDKKGFIRRWWQGELNWKETPGERQMRQTIEDLLAESD